MARILIADDAHIGRINIKKVVEEAGHEIAGEAENGLQAFQMFMRFHPDLVTMDITMPVMDGITALNKILASDPAAKVIMISAMGQQMMVLNSIKSGARHFIVKPFKDDDLLKTINEVLGLTGRPIEPMQAKLAKPAKPPETEAGAEKQPKKGFSIANVSGTLVINITADFNEEDLKHLNKAMEGITYITPLNVLFDFGDTGFLSMELLGKINGFMQTIKDAGGEARFHSTNRQFGAYLKAAGLTETSST